MAKKAGKVRDKKKEISKSFWERNRWEILIFVVSFLLYFNSIPNDYNLDDELVTQNHRLTSKGISAIPEIFTSPYYQDDMGYAYEYRPVVLASFAVEHQFFGDNPHVSHFFNVILYALCCILLYRVLLTILTGVSPLFLLAITLLFVVHPAHTEIVCSIKNRDEIFGLIFGLLALLLAYKAVAVKRNYLFLLLPLVFMLSLMSKMSSITFAVIIPIVVILFTETDFKRVMLISFLLVLPSFFILNVGNLYQKILTELGLVIVVIVFYSFYNFRKLSISIPIFIKSLFSNTLNVSDNIIFKRGSGNFGDIFKGIKPDSSIWNFRSIAVTVFTVALFYIGLIYDYPALVLLGAVGLFTLSIMGKEKMSWWADVGVYVCLLLPILKYPLAVTAYSDLVLIVLVWQVTWGNRKLFIPTAIVLAILITGSILTREFPAYHLAIAFIVLRWRYGWTITLYLMLNGLYSTYVGLTSGDTSIWSNTYGGLLALPMLISILLNKWSKHLVYTYKVMAVILLIVFQIKGGLPLSNIAIAPNTFKTSVVELGSKVNTNIISVKQDRPFEFVEQSVGPNDPWQLRAGTSLEILFQYLHKVVLPYPMAFYYGYKFIKPVNITSAIPIISLLIHLMIGIMAIIFIRKDKIIGIGLFIYLLSILAVSNYFIPILGQIAERFLFVPSIGWCIVYVALIFKIFKVNNSPEKLNVDGLPNGLKYLFTGLFCIYSAITFSRNFDWKDDITLFRHDINYVDQSTQAQNLLALHLMKKSYSADQSEQLTYRKEALVHFKKALEIYPLFYNVTFDLGRVYSTFNEADSSITYFKKAIAIDSTNSDAHLFVGNLLVAEKKLSEAIPYFEYVIRRRPEMYKGYESLSYIYFNLGQYNKSIEVNRSAIIRLPLSPDPLINMGRAFFVMNEIDSARICLQRALRNNPGNQTALELLSRLNNKQ